MKTRNILFTGLVSVAALLSSCNDFQEINEDPNLVGEDKVKPQWFLNASIMGDQMNPEIAERIFILYWDRASRFNRGSGFTIGTDNNDYSTIYLSNDYAVGWLNQVTKAIQLGERMVANGEADTYPYYKNVIQMSRIWRAYLNSEVADGFGPIPALAAFSGVPAEYDSVEAIYQFILKELREAESALDPSLDMSAMANEDAFYAGNVAKWKKYANSLRMRLAMRISAVDPVLAKAEFEDAASKTFISEPTDIASVQEKETTTYQTSHKSISFKSTLLRSAIPSFISSAKSKKRRLPGFSCFCIPSSIRLASTISKPTLSTATASEPSSNALYWQMNWGLASGPPSKQPFSASTMFNTTLSRRGGKAQA